MDNLVDKKKLTVGLVVYEQSAEEIEGLVNDLLIAPFDTTLYIIDNSSTPCGVEKFKSKHVDVIFSGENLGYGKGHNIAINEALKLQSDFHLIVNPDIRISENVLKELAKFVCENESTGFVIPRVYYPNGEFQHIYKLLPNPFILFTRMFARYLPNAFVNKMNYSYELRFKDFSESFELPVVSGCFMFCRTEVLRQIGGFDDRYFMYFEDVDISRRASLKYRNMFVPIGKVTHNFNKQSFRNSRLKKEHLKSAFKYFVKWGFFS
jgi:GT2 family glycosyltransferase